MISMRPRDRNTLMAVVGWLFADLLLALAMFFATTNTLVVIPPTPTPTPTLMPTPQPTPTLLPSPTPLACLLRQPVMISITLQDYNAFIQGSSSELQNVETQVRSYDNPALGSGKYLPALGRAGLVLIYAGTPSTAVGGTALEVGDKIVAALQDLGRQGYVFGSAVYHPTLLTPGRTYNDISLEVYLYAEPGKACT